MTTGYNEYREICNTGNGRAQDWSDLTDVLSTIHIDQLKELYEHLDDIDLFVGGFLEKPHEDALIGRTFQCIVGDTFAR